MKNKIILALFSVTVFASAAISQEGDREAARKERAAYVDKQATVDYERVESGTAEELELRKRINRRYDNEGWVVRNPHHETAGIGRIDEVPPPPIIPVKESSLVIAGRVISANAYLSNDKQGIYTEFSICVSEILKADPLEQDLKKGGCVTADRPGGVVRMPTGQVVWYADSNRGLPKVGREYALFLTRDNVSPNYSILRLYELDNKSVTDADLTSRVKEFELTGRSEFLIQIKKEVNRLSESPNKP